MHRSTRRVIAALLVAIAALFAFTGCSSEEPATAETSKIEANTTDPKTTAPANLDGRWIAEGFEAVITPDLIEIQMVDNTTDTRGLYWLGTFPLDNTNTILSVADTTALEMSLLGSSETQKLFTIEGDTIQFEMSMMGITQTITLNRQ